MRLLISVTDGAEATAALAGGADLIDAKDPTIGALGAVSIPSLGAIVAAVAGVRPVTAALGDATDEAGLERAAFAFTAAGACLVKVGFAGISTAQRVRTLIAAAVAGATAGHGNVVAVAYADARGCSCLEPEALVEAAVRAGARGVLLDTADKHGPGLRGLMRPGALARWVAAAHAARLLVGLAGKLTADDLPFVRDIGADIAGVRGAACEGGREGHVTADRVRHLRTTCGPDHASARDAANPRDRLERSPA